MGLSGSFSTMPFPDLLQWMASARKTGTLTIRSERHSKIVYLKEGRVVSTASDDPAEHLGQFLLSRGSITEEQLRKGLQTQAKTRVLLGRVLVTVGAIKEDEIKRLLAQKAEETLFGIFLWREAHFEFQDLVLPAELFIPIALDVQEVLLSGASRLDELRHIRRAFGSAKSVLRRTSRPVPDGFSTDRSPAGVILRLVDGRRSIAEIYLAAHATEFAASKVLFQFYRQGYLEIASKVGGEQDADEADTPPLPAESLVVTAREHLAAGRAEQALDCLRQARVAAPHDAGVQKLYDQACAAFSEAVYRSDLPPQRVPVLTRDLASLQDQSLRPEEVFLLSRINGSWDLKSIIDISPLAEVDALRHLRDLLRQGLIALR